ncbi:hypothetical protein ACXVUM_15890 [Williamsia sp. SKLECPSW1]
MTLFQRIANGANKAVFPLLRVPGVAGLLGRSMVVLEYTGRKSGRTIRLPVNYTQKGETVTVTVAAPGQKSWWKNFSGDGAPITLDHPGGGRRDGHAITRTDDRGRRQVVIDLAPPS